MMKKCAIHIYSYVNCTFQPVKKYVAFMQIDEKVFHDLISNNKHHSYLIGAKRSSLCSSRLFDEDSCSEHKE